MQAFLGIYWNNFGGNFTATEPYVKSKHMDDPHLEVAL